jgi:hypothetical protein
MSAGKPVSTFPDIALEKGGQPRVSPMRFLRAVVAFLVLLLAVAPAASAEDPETIVRAIYAQYGEGGQAFDVPVKYFTPGLLNLWEAADAAAEGGVEKSLGFQIFTDAAEKDVIDGVETHFINGKFVVVSFMAMVEEAKAIVGHKKYFMYSFAEMPEGWKIDNIDWGREKPTLRDMLDDLQTGKKAP